MDMGYSIGLASPQTELRNRRISVVSALKPASHWSLTAKNMLRYGFPIDVVERNLDDQAGRPIPGELVCGETMELPL
jgi:hypothetical protein